jgi:hypothetical protein
MDFEPKNRPLHRLSQGLNFDLSIISLPVSFKELRGYFLLLMGRSYDNIFH